MLLLVLMFTATLSSQMTELSRTLPARLVRWNMIHLLNFVALQSPLSPFAKILGENFSKEDFSLRCCAVDWETWLWSRKMFCLFVNNGDMSFDAMSGRRISMAMLNVQNVQNVRVVPSRTFNTLYLSVWAGWLAGGYDGVWMKNSRGQLMIVESVLNYSRLGTMQGWPKNFDLSEIQNISKCPTFKFQQRQHLSSSPTTW